jgi:hypothetical protein
MLPAVPSVVPLLYFAILFCEAVGLTGLYLLLQPDSSSWLNVLVGTVGLSSMIAMLVYSLARRSKTLRSWMRLSAWLHLHIFLGLQGVLFAYVHCLPLLWRHGWPILVNPGMLNLYAVTVVFFSGLFGRYLYAFVPKNASGQPVAGIGGSFGGVQRLFSTWILLHRPIAAAMYLLSFVHVALSLAFMGY